MAEHIRIGTRGSRLAMIQAGMVETALRPFLDGETERVVIRTEGDRRGQAPLAHIGGKGVFVKDLEAALAAGRIDMAVHSCKDLPAEMDTAFRIGAVLPRGPTHDVLISRDGAALPDLAPGCRIATGSLRRQALLLAARPDVRVEPMRGNVDTRVRKLEAGECDALVLAAAAVERIGSVPPAMCAALDDPWFLPAPAQGAIVVQQRATDTAVGNALARIDAPDARVEVEAERAFLAALGGDCTVPVGARARLIEGQVRLRGLVASPDGRHIVREEATCDPDGAAEAARALGRRLLEAGGAAWIAEGRDAD